MGTYNAICPRCQSKFSKEIRHGYIPTYCSKSCANKRSHTNQTKIKISKSVRNCESVKSQRYGPHTKIKFNPILGKFFPKNFQPSYWASPSRIRTVKVLAESFNFDIGKKDTIYNVENSIKLLEYHYYEEKLSASEIKNLYNINYTDFGMFLKKCLGFELRDYSSANRIQYRRYHGEQSDRDRYWLECKFRFNPYKFPKQLVGFNLIEKYGWYNRTNNPHGVVRDHKISIWEGYHQGINSIHMSHPANCEIMPFKQNNIKNKRSSITYDELLKQIEEWNEEY